MLVFNISALHSCDCITLHLSNIDASLFLSKLQ